MLIRKSAYRKTYLLYLLCLVVLPITLAISVALSMTTEKLFIQAVSVPEKKIFIIDAGHGGEDCGAIGKSGIYEKDLNMQIAKKLGSYLEKSGYIVIYTRTEDKLLYTEEQNIKGQRKINDLKNRLAISDAYPGATFISIHMNSFSDSIYKGLQVYYSPENNESRMLADSIQQEVKNRLQPDNNRQIKPGNNLYLLENAKNTSILIECGFISNSEECENLSEKEYQKELCFAIVCGIIAYKGTQ